MSFPQLITALARVSVQAAVVVLVILLVQFAFRRWLVPRWRCALWLLLVARLLLPFSLPSAASIFNVLPVRHLQAMPVLAAMDFPIIGNEVERPVPSRSSVSNSDSVVSGPGRVAPPWKSEAFWAVLWLAGFCLVTANIALRSIFWARRFAGSPRVADPDVLEVVEESARRLGIRKRIPVYESRAVSSPVLYGAIRPRLVLPRGFVGQFSREEIGFVVMHEMVHFKRGDLALNWLVAGLQAVHWFNPLVWIGFARWRADRELACDAAVLEAVGDDRSRNYGETIIQLLEGWPRQAAIPGHVGVLDAPGDIRMRLAMIMEFKPASRWSMLAALLLGALGMACLTNPRLVSTTAFPAAVSLVKAVIAPPPPAAPQWVGLQPTNEVHQVPVAAIAPAVHHAAPAAVAQKPRLAIASRTSTQPLVVLPSPPAASAGAAAVRVAAVRTVRAPAALAAARVPQPAPGAFVVRGIRVGITGALTSRGRRIERASLAHPVYYIPVAAGYRADGLLEDGIRAPVAAYVERALLDALAGQGYQVASKASPPALILVLSWGYEGADLSETWDSRIPAYEVQGTDRFFEVSPMSTHPGDIQATAHHALGYIRINAFDYAGWRQHKVVPLWSAEAATNRLGSLGRLLPTVLATAAPYFGRQTDQDPVFLTSSR